MASYYEVSFHVSITYHLLTCQLLLTGECSIYILSWSHRTTHNHVSFWYGERGTVLKDVGRHEMLFSIFSSYHHQLLLLIHISKTLSKKTWRPLSCFRSSETFLKSTFDASKSETIIVDAVYVLQYNRSSNDPRVASAVDEVCTASTIWKPYFEVSALLDDRNSDLVTFPNPLFEERGQRASSKLVNKPLPEEIDIVVSTWIQRKEILKGANTHDEKSSEIPPTWVVMLYRINARGDMVAHRWYRWTTNRSPNCTFISTSRKGLRVWIFWAEVGVQRVSSEKRFQKEATKLL